MSDPNDLEYDNHVRLAILLTLPFKSKVWFFFNSNNIFFKFINNYINNNEFNNIYNTNNYIKHVKLKFT
jgi:hypothetical protein